MIRRKKVILSFTLLFVIALFLISTVQAENSSGTTAGEVSEEVSEAARSIGDYTIDQKDEAMKSAKMMMDDLKNKMDRYESSAKEKWADAKEDVKEKHGETMRSLKMRKEKIAQWYEKMQESSPEAWQDVKKGFSDSYNELTDAFKKAAEDLN